MALYERGATDGGSSFQNIPVSGSAIFQTAQPLNNKTRIENKPEQALINLLKFFMKSCIIKLVLLKQFIFIKRLDFYAQRQNNQIIYNVKDFNQLKTVELSNWTGKSLYWRKKTYKINTKY